MEIFDAIFGRRSVRRYQERPIEPKLLEKIIEAAHWAPSAGNINPRYFISVTEPRAIDAIKALSPGMFGKPMAIVALCADRAKAEEKASTNGYIYSMMDVAMSAQNLLLAAHALGLGACVIRSFHPGATAKVMGCPEHVVPELLVALGYPEGPVSKGIRPELRTLYRKETWEGGDFHGE